MIQMKAVGTRGSRLPRAEALVSLTGSLRRLLPHRFCCSLCLGLPQSMTLWPPAHNGLERRVDGACLRLELRGGTAASARRLRARHRPSGAPGPRALTDGELFAGACVGGVIDRVVFLAGEHVLDLVPGTRKSSGLFVSAWRAVVLW